MLMETLLSTFDALSSRPLQRVKEVISRQKDEQPMTHADQPVPLAFQFQLFADGSYCIPYMDEAIRTLYRIDPEHSDQELGKRLLAMVHPGDLNKLKASFNLSARNLTPWHKEYRLQFDDTPPCWLSGTALPQRQQDGSVLWRGILTDITKKKQDEANLRIAATAFELQDAILVTDADGGILKVNQAFTRITGYSADEVIGQKPSMLSSGLHNKDFYAAMWESLNRTGNWRGEVWNRRKDGEIYPQWIIITAIKDAPNKIKHYVASFSDISSRKAAEEEIRQMAFYDPLTQLPNRRLLQERLKHSIDVERRDNKRLAILMLDLDRFKNVNDSFGHLAGDELLQHVAARILDRLRDVDMVSRLGGDEFVVLLEDIAHPEDAARIAAEIIAELSHPFQLSQCSDVQIGTSIGISLYPEHGDTDEILLSCADTALYQAKEQGRGCYAYFSAEHTQAARERIALETRLRHAVEQQQLRVFYQPQVDIESGRIVGAEALVRWQDPVAGLVPSLHFIALAEESGLIFKIGEWVLRETCHQGRQWQDAGLPPLNLAVNISPKQFQRGDLTALVIEALNETGFPAHCLELELTERGLMDKQTDVLALLNKLHALGVRLTLDDFGTGFSSLAHLKHFPLDTLKIDSSFIADIPHAKDDMEITATIIAMSRILGFKVLAEGVETPEQLAFLQEKNCNLYQGYLKSPAVSAQVFTTLLHNQKAADRLHEFKLRPLHRAMELTV